tara:strand:+ start:2833 stop:3822 length:990 start_codon:yes stop_codon:yes gene_type:complete
LSELQKLKDLSAKIGKNNMLVQSSGGNTSLKEGEVIYIKASGKRLREAKKSEIFVQIKRNYLQKEFSNKNKSDISLKNKLRPSIETIIHLLLNKKVIIHTHPIEIIAATLNPKAKDYFKKILNDLNWSLIPYAAPGKSLSILISKAQAATDPDIYILANHGLIICEETVERAEVLHDKIISKIKLQKRKLSTVNWALLKKISSQIPGSFIPNSPVIHSLAIDPWSFNLSCRNPFYPDHLIFCGKNPYIVYDSKKIELDKLLEEKYLLIKGVGVLLRKNKNEFLEEMLLAQAEIFRRIPLKSEVNSLSDQECEQLSNREDEIYRINLQKK